MSRTHERAYRLLAERVRLSVSARRALYATLAALIGSGVWWIFVHYAGNVFAARSDDLHRLAQEGLALKVHGATAFATLFAMGAMSARHARVGWDLKRNRVTGSIVITAFVLMIATGYALYYLVNDDTHVPIAVLHWALGLALAPTLLAHIVVGRRARSALDVGLEPRRRPSGSSGSKAE